MTRNRESAKKAGADLEIGQEAYWREKLQQPYIYRGKAQGEFDKGDILAVEPWADRGPLTIECKNVAKMALGTWWKEAERERLNNVRIIWKPTGTARVQKPEEHPSPAAVVIHKRRGFDAKKQPGKQWLTMTVEEFIAIITGNRDHITD